MCTGSFVENGRPPLGTKCAKPCVQQSGRWGWSWCYTKQDESQWGAECENCPGRWISASYALELVTKFSHKYLNSIMHFIRKFTLIGDCVPYSKQACEEAVGRHGLQKGGGGYNFVGTYPTKGCYTYKSGNFANMAYYGVGGTEDQIKVKLTFPLYRPLGYDCITNGKIEYFYYFLSA